MIFKYRGPLHFGMAVVASAGYVPDYPTAYYSELFLDFVSTINRPAEESLLISANSISRCSRAVLRRESSTGSEYKLTA